MWRRAYLLLALVRLYFALSPSYLHPDENFQGPEVIAGTSIYIPSPRHPDIPESAPFPSIIVCALEFAFFALSANSSA